ncbi:hypothetical protein RB594_009516 [Gaeumannomyces avenae]
MVRLATLMSTVTLAVSTASAAYGGMVQDVSGFTYVTKGPAREGNIRDYWYPTSQTALSKLKALLGPDRLKELLAPEISKADDFWRDIVARSTGASWKAAEGRTLAFLPNVTAMDFTRWFSSPLADAANNDANAEHYYKKTIADPASGVMRSEIIEGWGGVITHFTVPKFAAADRARHPMLRELPEFPIQFAGDKTLLDGTVFGVLHIAVRDVKPSEYPDYGGAKGIEVYAAVWYGDASEDAHLETEREHMIIEEINMSLQCQRDIVSGRLPPAA